MIKTNKIESLFSELHIGGRSLARTRIGEALRRHVHEAFILVLCVLLSGCTAPEPQIVIQTRVVEREKTREVIVFKEITRLVREVVTATPPQPSPTPRPVVRLGLATELCTAANQEVYQHLAEVLGRHTGFDVEVVEIPDDQQAVEALCSGSVDLAWLSISAYLLANEACGVEARFMATYQGSAARVAQIMVQSAQERRARGLAPINSLEELNGQVFAFTDPLSATGYFFPKAMLAEANVKPAEEVFVGGDSQAVLVVYTGEADAAASYWAPPRPDGSPGDARTSLLNAYPDVVQKVHILRLSAPIPREPLVFRRDLPLEIKDRLIAALVSIAGSEGELTWLSGSCRMDGLVLVTDRDYDIVRKMVRALGLSYAQIAAMR